MPTSGDTCEIADSLLLDALDPCRRVECLSAGSVARAAPAVGRRRVALVTERDHVPVGVAGQAPRYANQFPRPWGSAENVLPGTGAEGLPGRIAITAPADHAGSHVIPV